jgi:radical SAM-linked protein
MRYLSHHDTLRLLQRALARAALPVRFSEGFNPHPRISIPLPRPVGIASRAEAVVVEFESPLDGGQALVRLQEQMPRDVEFHAARRLAEGEAVQPDLVRYRCELEAPLPAGLAERAAAVLAATSLPTERVAHDGSRKQRFDARPFIVSMSVDERGVEFTLRVTGKGTVRPGEVVELIGLDPQQCGHRLHRLDVQWKSGTNGNDGVYERQITKTADSTPTAAGAQGPPLIQ